MFSSADLLGRVFFVALAACGTNGDGDDSGLVDGAADSPCISSDGVYLVCQGSNDCFPPDARGDKKACVFCSSPDPTKPGLCSPPDGISAGPASDGQLYVETDPVHGLWGPYPYETGELFAENGGADQVRYADWSAWSGAPLPSPTSCPAPGSFRICGGNCGACQTGEICTGRSPNHPYSICAAYGCESHPLEDGGTTWIGCDADAGQACLTFQSSADGQPFADQHGFCISAAGCATAESSYPGGVFCHGP